MSIQSDEYVCWSRMQAEAGQSLESIIARKEIERCAGKGVFFWGVGNPPAVITRVLARARIPVKVIFSIMKSRPKAIDVSPSRTLVWRRYIDIQGVVRPLPSHVLVTSRGNSASGAKRSHYALMCRSDEPIILRRGEPFYSTAFRNAGGTGARVGASQVTALLRRVGENFGKADYETNVTAWLTDSYWIRLVDPIELDGSKLALLDSIGNHGTMNWHKSVAEIMSGQSPCEQIHATRRLL